MQLLSLAILYIPTGGKPLRVASVSDQQLLIQAAIAAVREAEDRATHLAPADEELSRVEQAEATRLRDMFAQLIPELRAQAVEGKPPVM